MAAQIVSFFQRTPRFVRGPSDWAQQEIAEFYRVESALIRAGLRVGTDRGVTDEGDPWFIFFRADDGEVVIHFARIDGEYLIAGPAYEEVARGIDFTALVRNMIARHPLVRPQGKRDNIFLHPAALLVAVVGTAFFKSGEAKAMEEGRGEPRRPVHAFGSATAALSAVSVTPSAASVQIPASQAVTVLAAAMMALEIRIDARDAMATSSAAIRAAALNLDFSGSESLLGSSMPARAPMAPQTHVDLATAKQVSALLSLVALLDTLPSAHDLGVPDAPAQLASLAANNDGSPTTAAAPDLGLADAGGHWLLDIRLNAGGLPAVEAVQLVRELAGEQTYQKIAVVQMAKLPDVLADIIARGEHINASGPDAVVQPTAPTPVESTGELTPAPAFDHEASGDAGAPTTVAPIPVVPTPTPAPATPLFSSTELVKQFVSYFVEHTVSIDLVVVGSTIVMFDSRVMHDIGAVQHLDSLTFNFADGSSISLVGEHSALFPGAWLG
ncbi:MAG: hypothetical protein JWP92_3643 [Caulobacter sp.]|nr:hypothetical protein [Caulobacter sp.]